MRKATRKSSTRTPKTQPTPEQIRRYMECMKDEHQLAWHHELMGDAPQWVYMIGLHLRIVELENMHIAAEEFL